jgi:hypothetical protein
MTTNVLQRIQEMQFTDKTQAELLLVDFIRQTAPLDVITVELRPLAVSLNSFNGYLTLRNNKRLFFKSHTEDDSIIQEYYSSRQLADAGYALIQPVYSSIQAGQQLLVYEVVDDPSVFDIAWQIEMGEQRLLPSLTQAQQNSDRQLFEYYLRTLQWQSAEEASQAPIHQLFYHRITGGRLARFYGALPHREHDGVTISLPGHTTTIETIRQVHWEINGQEYDETLDDLIGKSERLLVPTQQGPSIIGHGDAHNGNLFFQIRNNQVSLVYFDPAFAGRHHPLLDLAKPLFHNVFAMWMYFPRHKANSTTIELKCTGGTWHVEHNYELHGVRETFLYSKVEFVLKPILRELKKRGWLREDWREYLKAALFCCPLLTMNLTDQNRFPPEMCLLGLSMAMEMGAESSAKRSRIDMLLDRVAAES